MKKIVLSIIVALIAITANAQVYVGGTFGVGSDKVETEGTEVKNTTFKILPEVGYELNVNPEKPDVPLNKNDAFQKVQKRRVQEKR